LIDSIKLLNFNDPLILQNDFPHDCFILKTCQRTLVLGLGVMPINPEKISNVELMKFGEDAYSNLLEVICGLKSKVLGENEISNQFKKAYIAYSQSENRNPVILEILEKLFKDYKKIKTKYLMGLNQLSYAGITRKIILEQSKHDEIIIIGSGQLCEDIIKLMTRTHKTTIIARNQERLNELKKQYRIKTLSWCKNNQLEDRKIIINTAPTNNILFNEEYFLKWRQHNSSKGLFIDLSSPSVISTTLDKNNGVWKLEDVFGKGKQLDNYKQNQILMAKQAIIEIVERRNNSFSYNLPFSWEELQFA
jgi:glutamyl-tRNA reductase